MRAFLLSLLYLALITTVGCVFISEPDVGASDNGPGFLGEDGNQDPLDGEPGLSTPDRGNTSEVDGMAGEPPQPTSLDAGLVGTQDGEVTMQIGDAEVVIDVDATRPDVDMEVIPTIDAELPEDDAGLSTRPDMTVPSTDECGTIGCDDFGYCDDAERPECWIGEQPACYPFNTPDNTNLDAYARCCGHLGTCGPAGQWCEPEGPSACWLTGDQPQCYINPNEPLSQHLCEGRSRP